MTRDQYRVVQSSLGKFMRRVPKTSHWLSKLERGRGGWALKPGQGPFRGTGPAAPAAVRSDGAAARDQLSQKSYVGLPARGIKHFT